MQRTLFLGAVALMGLSAGPAAAGDLVLGRWCDATMSYRGIIEIVITETGEATARYRYGDGSEHERRLIERGQAVYEEVDSPFGDKYRIVPVSGELQLLDREGYIRSARRLQAKPTKGECYD